MNFITNWVTDTAGNLLKTGIQAGGALAGNAVCGVGELIESSGRAVGKGAAGGITGVGDHINGYGNGIKDSMAASGNSAPQVKKSAAVTSNPASRKLASATPAAAAARSLRSSSTQPTASTKTSSSSLPSSTRAKGALPPNSVPPQARSAQHSRPRTAPTSRTPSAGVQISPGSRPAPPRGQLGVGRRDVKPSQQQYQQSNSAKKGVVGNGEAPKGKVRISPASLPASAKR